MIVIHEQVQLEKARFWIDKGILFCEIKNSDENRNLEVEMAEQYVKAVVKLCKGKPMPAIIDLRGTKGAFVSEAAKILGESQKLKTLLISEAFVVNSLKMKLLVFSFKRIFDPNTRFEIFKTLEEALAFSLKAKEL